MALPNRLKQMQIYLVGGAVRDKLLGLPHRDRDFLVIGSSAEVMLKRGFIQVGKSFTVFLHPETHEEYTLATNLEIDLARRDLTINALALDEQGQMFDHFGGVADLKNKVLRHVQDENFFEDPLRVYRVARFKAQYPEFSIATETLNLMQKVSTLATFRAISSERIFAELKAALAASCPSAFFQVLKSVQALAVHFPEIASFEDHDWGHKMLLLDEASRRGHDLLVRFGSLMLNVGNKAKIEQFAKRLLIPNDWLEAAVTANRFYSQVEHIYELDADTLLQIFYEMDAFRKPLLVQLLAFIADADEMVRNNNSSCGEFWLECFGQVAAVSSKDIALQLPGKQVGDAIRSERVKRLQLFLNLKKSH